MSTIDPGLITLNSESVLYNDIDVIYIPRKDWNQSIKLNEFITNIEYTYGMDQASVYVTVSLIHNNELKDLISEGDNIVLFGWMIENGQVVFKELPGCRAVVVKREFVNSGNENTLTITAYDPMFYGNNNRTSQIIEAGTLRSRVSKICNLFGIPFDESSDDSSITLPRRVAINETVYDLILEDLIEINLRSNDKYIWRFIEGKLKILKRVIPLYIWGFTDSDQLISLNRSTSIIDTRNLIIGRSNDPLSAALQGIVEDDAENFPPITSYKVDQELIDKIGILSEEIIERNIKDQSDLESKIVQRLRLKSHIQETVILSIPNINGIYWGDPIWVYDEKTATAAVYWIDGGKHSWSSNGAKMELTASLQDRYSLLESRLEEQSKKNKDALGEFAEGFGR